MITGGDAPNHKIYVFKGNIITMALYLLNVTNDIRPFLQANPDTVTPAVYGHRPYGITYDANGNESIVITNTTATGNSTQTFTPSSKYYSPTVIVTVLPGLKKVEGGVGTLPGGATGTFGLLNNDGYFTIAVISNSSGPDYNFVTPLNGTPAIKINVADLLLTEATTYTILVEKLPYYTMTVNFDSFTISVSLTVYTVAAVLNDLFNPATLGAIYNDTDDLFVPGAVFQINTLNDYVPEFVNAGSIVYAKDASTMDTATINDKLTAQDSFFTFEVFTDKNESEFLVLRNLQWGYATWSITATTITLPANPDSWETDDGYCDDTNKATSSCTIYAMPGKTNDNLSPFTFEGIAFQALTHTQVQTAITSKSTTIFPKWTVVTAPKVLNDGTEWWNTSSCTTNVWTNMDSISSTLDHSPGPAPPKEPPYPKSTFQLICQFISGTTTYTRILTSGSLNPQPLIYIDTMGGVECDETTQYLTDADKQYCPTSSQNTSMLTLVGAAQLIPFVELVQDTSKTYARAPFMTAKAGTVLPQTILPYGTKYSTPPERVTWFQSNAWANSYTNPLPKWHCHVSETQYVSQSVNTSFYFTLLDPGLQLRSAAGVGLMYNTDYSNDCYNVSNLNGVPIVLFNSSAGATTCPEWSMLGFSTSSHVPTQYPCNGAPAGGPSVGQSQMCSSWPTGQEASSLQGPRRTSAKSFIDDYCKIKFTNGLDGITCKNLLDQPSPQCSGFRTDNYADACKFACLVNPLECISAQLQFCEDSAATGDLNDCACQNFNSPFKNTYTDMPNPGGVTYSSYAAAQGADPANQSTFSQCWWHPCVIDKYTALSKSVPYGQLSGSKGGCPSDLLTCVNVLQGGNIEDSTGVEIDFYNKCVMNNIKNNKPAGGPSTGAPPPPPPPPPPPNDSSGICGPGSSSCCIPGSPSCCSSGSCPAIQKKGWLTTWAMVGIVIGVFVLLMAAIIGGYKYYINKKSKTLK